MGAWPSPPQTAHLSPRPEERKSQHYCLVFSLSRHDRKGTSCRNQNKIVKEEEEEKQQQKRPPKKKHNNNTKNVQKHQQQQQNVWCLHAEGRVTPGTPRDFVMWLPFGVSRTHQSFVGGVVSFGAGGTKTPCCNGLGPNPQKPYQGLLDF